MYIRKLKEDEEEEFVNKPYLARTSPLTMTFLKGGFPNSAVESTNRV